MDKHDRTHPYGLDSERNKRLPNKVGENYGVTVFWGLPDDKDSIKSRLDKIEWLSTSYQRDVEWRRSMFLAMIMSGVLWFVIRPVYLYNLKVYMITFIILFIFLYFQTQYSKHHLHYRRSLFIRNHIHEIKEKLKLSTFNPIYKHLL